MKNNEFDEERLDLSCLDPAPGKDLERITDPIVERILSERARRTSWMGILHTYARWGAIFGMSAAALTLALAFALHTPEPTGTPDSADNLLSLDSEPTAAEILEIGLYPEVDHDAW